MTSLKKIILKGMKRFLRKKKISIPMYPNGLEKAKAFVKPKNQLKNRRLDAPCWDNTRVVLSKVGRSSSSDYIHANWVDGHKEEKMFIATQAPMANTVNDFLAMVSQNSCRYIIVLTKIMENGVEKCFPYWPTEENMEVVTQHWALKFELKKSGSGYTKYVLSLSPHRGQQKHQTIILYHYTNWPENRSPQSTEEFSKFLYTTRFSVARHRILNNDFDAPIVVHGSDGINRTVQYCTYYNIADMIEDKEYLFTNEQAFSVMNNITMMRYSEIAILN